MNKKLRILRGISITVGAILLNACAPVEGMDNELALDATSDSWSLLNGSFSEYGRCNDAWDNDGDGLVDSHDPDCHINAGPLRDLSLLNFPLGHNFFPDIAKIGPGPGFPPPSALLPGRGSFRNREQITSWFRFLTEPDGNVAGIDIMGIGVNPEVVPLPMISAAPIVDGTYASGNNNSISLRGLHATFLDHDFMPNGAVNTPEAKADAKEAKNVKATSEYLPSFYKTTQGRTGGWPGAYYKGGSQGALKDARTGNPDQGD